MLFRSKEVATEESARAARLREWHDGVGDGVTKAPWTTSANFAHLDSKAEHLPKEMVKSVDQTGMIRAYTERLAGL